MLRNYFSIPPELNSNPVKSAQNLLGKLLVRVSLYLEEVIRVRPGLLVIHRVVNKLVYR